jgi:phosphoacetylglucosamine mutase
VEESVVESSPRATDLQKESILKIIR